MKNPSLRRPQHGFTLVELLVVITIIAVLAGAGFAAGNAAIQRAKKITAMTTAVAIDSAVNNFYTDYGAMPISGTGSSDNDPEAMKTDVRDSSLLRILLALEAESANPKYNTKAVRYLSVNEGKKKGTRGLNGLIYNPTGSGVVGLFDPWGGAFFVKLDGNYDEKITVKPSAVKAELTLNGRRSATWSNGADGANGAIGKIADDVKTWGN